MSKFLEDINSKQDLANKLVNQLVGVERKKKIGGPSSDDIKTWKQWAADNGYEEKDTKAYAEEYLINELNPKLKETTEYVTKDFTEDNELFDILYAMIKVVDEQFTKKGITAAYVEVVDG